MYSFFMLTAMASVSKAIKELPADVILAYEKEGSLEVGGVKLEAGEIKVCRVAEMCPKANL